MSPVYQGFPRCTEILGKCLENPSNSENTEIEDITDTQGSQQNTKSQHIFLDVGGNPDYQEYSGYADFWIVQENLGKNQAI